MEQYSPRFGDAVAIAWKKADGSACGGTEGFVLGTLGDEVTGQFLVIDRSTYQDSFKFALFSLNILDLRVVPKQDIDSIKKTNVRQRPPGVSEEFSMLIEADYRSNIDFDSTILKVEKRSDCKPKRVGNSKSETYQMVIKKIDMLAGTTINIFCGRMIQIFCSHENLDRCINWIQEAVEILPGHKRLVLIPTKITYKIDDTYKELSRPTEEVIYRIAASKGAEPVVLPIGWVHRFFVELDENPLRRMFPNDRPLEDFVLKREKEEEDSAVPGNNPVEERSQRPADLRFSGSSVNVKKYLGADAPVVRITGIIKTPEDEEGLMRMWLDSRSDCWQWFESAQFHGKIILRDLTIDKLRGIYTVDVRKHSGNEF